MPGSEAALDPPVLAGVRRSHAHCPGLCPDCVCSGERSSGGKETVTGPQVHRLPGEEPNRTSQAVESKYLHFCASSLPPRSAHGRVCKACNGRECSPDADDKMVRKRTRTKQKTGNKNFKRGDGTVQDC